MATGEMMLSISFRTPAWFPWRSQAALALHRLGRGEEARQLATEEVELARQWGAPRTLGIALRALGLVEQRAAEQVLREATDVLAPSHAKLEHARALIDLGATLRRANRRREAQDLVRRGLDLAYRVGAASLASRAKEELAALGARPRTPVLTGIEALTGSERRVARLAGDGLSNKEIAQALFVTVKAVEVHLTKRLPQARHKVPGPARRRAQRRRRPTRACGRHRSLEVASMCARDFGASNCSAFDGRRTRRDAAATFHRTGRSSVRPGPR